MNRKFSAFLLAVFTIALLPKDVVNFYGLLGITDPMMHMAAFAGISIFCIWNYRPSILIAFIVVALICIVSESLQGLLTQTRGFSWDDILKNTIGSAIIFIPFTVFSFFYKGKRKKTKNI